MGFQKPDLVSARHAIGRSLVEIRSPYNDGYTSEACKHDLYLLKCWLDEEYARLPRFSGEDAWEKERLIDHLRR